MKILFISDYYPPYIKAGAEVSTALLASWLAQQNNDVSVACSEFADKPWVEKGVTVYPIIFKPYAGSKKFLSALWRALMMPIQQLVSTIRVLKLIRDLQPDIVNAVTYSRLHPIIIGVKLFSRRPIVIDCRAYDLVCPAHLSPTYLGKPKDFDEEIQSSHGYRCVGYSSPSDPSFLSIRPFAVYEAYVFNLYKYALRFLVNHFDGIVLVGVSKYVQRQLILNGFRPGKTTSIYNISECLPEKTVETGDNPGLVSGVPTFAYGGRIERDKGIWDVVAAVEILQKDLKQPFAVTIAGKGGEFNNVQAYIQEKGLDSIHLLGHIKPEAVLASYNKSVAIIGPSRWPEPFGRFVVESMSVGKPLITTRTGGCQEGVDEGKTGLLFDPGNAGQLAAAMKYFIEDPGRSQAMKAAIVDKQKQYQGDVIGSKRLALYKSLLERTVSKFGSVVVS